MSKRDKGMSGKMKKKLPCLGRFEKHSCHTWWWNREKQLYFHECALMGCSFSETAERLRVVGKVAIVDNRSERRHDWGAWKTTADQLGEYTPPWLYERKCKNCKAKQMAKNLKK